MVPSPILSRSVLETFVQISSKCGIGGGEIWALVFKKCMALIQITEAFPNSDVCFRRVKVKTKGGILMQPIDKCELLEADQEKTQWLECSNLNQD